MTRGALLITDSYKNTVNGISVFSHFFVNDILLPKYNVIIVLESSTKAIYGSDEDFLSLHNIEVIYVNANFSKSDCFFRQQGFTEVAKDLGLVISPNAKFIIISHGWPKIKPRLNYYGVYYWLKNISRSKDLSRLQFYHEVLFISQACDSYRHNDYLYCIENNVHRTFYDFPTQFVNKTREQHQNARHLQNSEPIEDYILTIANFEKIKNLWWLVRYNLKRKLSRNLKMKKFVVITNPKKNISFKLFSFCARRLMISLLDDQGNKFEVIQRSNYLFIPSFSEYTPIVAFEAVSLGKKVVSLYKIESLSKNDYYHYLLD